MNKRLRADWLSKARLGAFMHFLPGVGAGPASVAGFDVEALAQQLEWIGARYFVFTLSQNSGWVNAPNAAYDRLAGFRPGERCSTRDLPLELHRALSARDIRLMLYLPCQTPNRDPRAQHGFGFPPGHVDQPISVAAARKWAEAIYEWSARYGEKVSGWWFDAGYAHIGFNEEIAGIYAHAVKRGNPRAIVSFNPGIMLLRHTQAEDYTAGELNEPLSVVPDSRLVDGSQWHCLTYLGSDWGRRNARYATGQWLAWARKVFARGGAVTLDMGPNMNPEAGFIGELSVEQATQFRVVALQAADTAGDSAAVKASAGRIRLPVRSGLRRGSPGPLCTVWPFDAEEARRRQAEYGRSMGLPVEQIVDLGGGVEMAMVLIPPGEFLMGSSADERGRDSDEGQHRVTLCQGFYLGKHPVTQAQWDAVLGSNPSKFKGANHPVDQAHWEDCQALCRRLGPGFRLPTEAEWEYACRAGTGGAYAGALDDMAWHDGNSGTITHAVGQKKPNAWGLHDMHGNVWEWCADWYHSDPGRAAVEPGGHGSERCRVIRGGSWMSAARDCRCAERNGRMPGNRNDDLGFRLVYFFKRSATG